MNEINFLVVHCSDSPNDRDIGARQIHEWHTIGNGWDGIGYHAVIRRSGIVEPGRPIYWPGAHVKGYNNSSLGVCLVGEDSFTDAQMAALRILLNEWKELYPEAEVIGHKDLDPNKTCPNFNVKQWWSE